MWVATLTELASPRLPPTRTGF